MSEKKVVAVIVEEPSDESAIGSILKEYFFSEEVQFAVTHGDITSDDKYEGKVQDFIEFISNEDIAVPGTYKETWKYIEKDQNSLQRHSNMHLIFQQN